MINLIFSKPIRVKSIFLFFLFSPTMTKSIVFPGQRLGRTQQYQSGPGTYIRHGIIYASLVGKKEITTSVDNEDLPILSVLSEKESTSLPEIDSIIIGRVLRVNPRFATVSILAVGSKPCKENFQGIIRTQDVRSTEKDKIKMYECFRPGDIIRAQVISLGDARSYYLSTAFNELGVIFARCSISGSPMIPISWKEMQCIKTKTIEYRKCAKP
jgi:exosome complex component CSL4